ncbi:MAG: hypothetical protein ACP5JP_10530, partial [bacterium]
MVRYRHNNCYVSVATGILFLLLLGLTQHIEASLVQQPEKIIVASDDNYPPFIFRDEDGKLNG